MPYMQTERLSMLKKSCVKPRGGKQRRVQQNHDWLRDSRVWVHCSCGLFIKRWFEALRDQTEAEPEDSQVWWLKCSKYLKMKKSQGSKDQLRNLPSWNSEQEIERLASPGSPNDPRLKGQRINLQACCFQEIYDEINGDASYCAYGPARRIVVSDLDGIKEKPADLMIVLEDFTSLKVMLTRLMTAHSMPMSWRRGVFNWTDR